jgi:ABC-type transport system involved in cytochrome c biogenesis permease subunit
LEAYEAARAALAAQAWFWNGLVGLLAAVAIGAAVWRLVREDEIGGTAGKLQSRVAGALAIALWAGWARLAWFHWQVFKALRIPDFSPETGVPLSGRGGGLAVPLWIEGEKLYAWACLLALAVVLLWRRRRDPVFSWGLAAVGGLVLLALISGDPFGAPLPGLHSELTGYAATIRTGDAATATQAAQAMWARKTFFYNTAYMWTHPPALFVSYAAFVVSFIACVLLLATRGVRYDRIAYDYAKFGYLVLTGGMLIGYPWAILAWKGDPWWWSGKINMSLMMWVMYSGYLHSRLYLARRGMWKLAGWLGVVCFATLVLTYLSTYLVPGAHSVAQP